MRLEVARLAAAMAPLLSFSKAASDGAGIPAPQIENQATEQESRELSGMDVGAISGLVKDRTANRQEGGNGASTSGDGNGVGKETSSVQDELLSDALRNRDDGTTRRKEGNKLLEWGKRKKPYQTSPRAPRPPRAPRAPGPSRPSSPQRAPSRPWANGLNIPRPTGGTQDSPQSTHPAPYRYTPRPTPSSRRPPNWYWPDADDATTSTDAPTRRPTRAPTPHPTKRPTTQPTKRPSTQPTKQPTKLPTKIPTKIPTKQPSKQPTQQPTKQPTKQPTQHPTEQPSKQPTQQPTKQPTRQPTTNPTSRPPLPNPVEVPTRFPSAIPTKEPTSAPTSSPAHKPSATPSVSRSAEPSVNGSSRPSTSISAEPSRMSSDVPSIAKSSMPSIRGSARPSAEPTDVPTSSQHPTYGPTPPPEEQLPTASPIQGNESPTAKPTALPSVSPTQLPSTKAPTLPPTHQPSSSPTAKSTHGPTTEPTSAPIELADCPEKYSTSNVTFYEAGSEVEVNHVVYKCGEYPWAFYCAQESFEPGVDDNALWRDAWVEVGECVASPTSSPSTKQPTDPPTNQPTDQPTARPTDQPTARPTDQPTAQPTNQPTDSPTVRPTKQPTKQPTKLPTKQPSNQPTKQPTTDQPTYMPSSGEPTPNPIHDADYSQFPFPYPHTRFTQWIELEADEMSIASSLGYDRDSWDNLEISELEGYIYQDLTAFQQENVKNLGMDENMWNCYMNHYNGYYWADLEQEGVAQYWVVLGWNQASWDGGIGTPATNDMYWRELSESQQEAAYKLCFSRNAWDWISLTFW